MTIPVALGVVAFGVLVGGLSALFGIGGGVVMVPFIVLLLGGDQHVAEGTSLLVIVPTAIAGVIAHARRGFVDFRSAAWLAVGGVVGAFVGARVALASSNETLEAVFAGFLVLMGARLLAQSATGSSGEAKPDRSPR